ncbi:SDR family oxidoreductase [candidate division KSB1 bacterium]
MPPEKSLSDKVAVVTGGGRGIGHVIAEYLMRSGASVIITGRDEERLKRAVRTLRTAGKDKVSYYVFDVSDAQAVERSFNRITGDCGPVDILVNNAGIATFKPVFELTTEEWNRMISVNLNGAFFCTRSVLPSMMQKKSGAIVNITSVASIKAFSGCSAYAAAKSGLLMFTRVLREEVRDSGIRVSAVILGATRTEIWDESDGDFDKNKMIDPAAVGSVVRDICTLPDSALIEEVIIRPAGGDL